MEAAGNISTEERDTCIDIEGEYVTEREETRMQLTGGKEILSGTTIGQHSHTGRTHRVTWVRTVFQTRGYTRLHNGA